MIYTKSWLIKVVGFLLALLPARISPEAECHVAAERCVGCRFVLWDYVQRKIWCSEGLRSRESSSCAFGCF